MGTSPLPAASLRLLAVLAWLLGATAAAAADAATAWSAQDLYREGRTEDGRVLVGARPGGTSLEGAAAACIACHRRSGLGTAEGRSVIPPVTGEFLFRPRSTHLIQGDQGNQSLVADASAGVTAKRSAYDDRTLMRALREGVGADGQPLSVLMPRYALSDHEAGALVTYLRALGTRPVPGLSDDTLDFATVVTPDADPGAREAMLATLRQFFHDRNHIIAGAARPMASNDKGVLFRVTRKWQLHVWELTGPAAGWPAQLDAWFQREPVFALVSGLGGADWSAVHDFCERREVPCLLPNVQAPPPGGQDFYSVYFSQGVFLEAELIRAGLADAALAAPVQRVVQVVRAGGSGVAAANLLAGRLAGQGVEVEVRQLAPADGAGQLARLVQVDADSALVLWLGAADLAALPASPPPASRVWLSALSAGVDQPALPAAWRDRVELAYPFELPDRRALALKLPEGWFRIKQIALDHPREQLQTYLACQVLSEMVGEMHVALVPDYLVERTEVMLSHRRLNALYPRLSLGAGQRFASKGGYLAHIDAAGRLVADGDWRVP